MLSGVLEETEDVLRAWFRRLLSGAPLLAPLLAVCGAIAGGSAGWALATLAIAAPAVLRLWRIAACALLCAAFIAASAHVRRQQAAQLVQLLEQGSPVEMQGTVVQESGSGFIVSATWPGVRVALRGDMPWQVADEVRFVAEGRAYEQPLAKGMFSMEQWLRGQGAAASLTCLSYEHLGVSCGWSRLVRWAGQLRAACVRRLMPPGAEKDACRQVLCALVLGEKSHAEAETLDIFRRGGCMHAFAVSGLHVGLVAGILWGLLHLLRVRPTWARCALLCLLSVYVAATGLGAPALRAFAMLLVALGGLILRRRPRLLNTWCCAALLILLWQPWQLHQAGFQLSFVIYAAICCGVRVFMRCARWFGPDAYLPACLHTGAERFAAYADASMRSALIVSLCAWLVSLPFSIIHFHTINTASYITNLAIAPWLPVVMLCGLLALAFGGLPVLGQAFFWLADRSAALLIWLVSATGSFPGAFLPACPPAAADSFFTARCGYGRSFCVLGNPGILIGDVRHASSVRYTVEPAIFHSGLAPFGVIGSSPASLAILRRSWPHMQELPRLSSFSSPAGNFHLFYPPQVNPAAGCFPIVLWVQPSGKRVLYIGCDSPGALDALPPSVRQADIIIRMTKDK